MVIACFLPNVLAIELMVVQPMNKKIDHYVSLFLRNLQVIDMYG